MLSSNLGARNGVGFPLREMQIESCHRGHGGRNGVGRLRVVLCDLPHHPTHELPYIPAPLICSKYSSRAGTLSYSSLSPHTQVLAPKPGPGPETVLEGRREGRKSVTRQVSSPLSPHPTPSSDPLNADLGTLFFF